MTVPKTGDEWPEHDPGVPRFVVAIGAVALVSALWVVLSPGVGFAPVASPTVEEASASLGPEASGATLYVREGCGTCHSTLGESTASGPSLAGAAQHAASRIHDPGYTGLADTPPGYLREATLDHCVDLLPGYEYDCAQVVDVGLRLDSAQVDRLVSFVAGLPAPVAP